VAIAAMVEAVSAVAPQLVAIVILAVAPVTSAAQPKKASATNARVVSMTALQVKVLLAVMHVRPVAISSLAAISRHLAVTLAPHVVISVRPVVTLVPASQLLVSLQALPNLVTVAKCLCRATRKSVLPATLTDMRFAA
jgi:hypothetical protein